MISKIHVTQFQFDHGPGRLASTLKRGLTELGIELVSLEEAEYVAGLQWMDDHLKVSDFLGKKALMGPNIWETPSERPYLVERFYDFIVPSAWVRNKHLMDPIMADRNVHVWSGGIETDVWRPQEVHKDIDCFVYFKNRAEEDLVKLASQLARTGLKCVLLRYGSYKEEQLFELCQRSKFAILCTGTESQGYAYMQMLSAGIPCLVMDTTSWLSRDATVEVSATSVPYFDSRCGTKNPGELTAETILEFSENYQMFRSREYMLEHHTIRSSTLRYLDLFASQSMEIAVK